MDYTQRVSDGTMNHYSLPFDFDVDLLLNTDSIGEKAPSSPSEHPTSTESSITNPMQDNPQVVAALSSSSRHPTTTDNAVASTSAAASNDAAPNADGNDIEDDDSRRVMVPPDPNDWDAGHIAAWLRWLEVRCQIEPALQATQFPSRGADLVQMRRADFVVSAGSRSGGRLLAMHVAHLVRQVSGSIGRQEEDQEPGIFSRA